MHPLKLKLYKIYLILIYNNYYKIKINYNNYKCIFTQLNKLNIKNV